MGSDNPSQRSAQREVRRRLTVIQAPARLVESGCVTYSLESLGLEGISPYVLIPNLNLLRLSGWFFGCRLLVRGRHAFQDTPGGRGFLRRTSRSILYEALSSIFHGFQRLNRWLLLEPPFARVGGSCLMGRGVDDVLSEHNSSTRYCITMQLIPILHTSIPLLPDTNHYTLFLLPSFCRRLMLI